MNILAQLDWRAPAWGLLALLPLLQEILVRWRRRSRVEYADAALRPWAIQTAAAGSKIFRRVLQFLVWGLLAAALAGPRLPLPESAAAQPHGQPVHNLTIYAVLDIGPAMEGNGAASNPVSRAKLKLEDLSARLHGERLGLIVYSGTAGLLSPPSDDPRVLRDAFDLVRPGLITQSGDALAASLKLALREAQGHRPAAVLLVNDASAQSLQGSSGETVHLAVDALARAHVPLYVLGVDTPAGLDTSGYRVLAAFTGGGFAQLSDGDEDLRTLYDHGLARLPVPASALTAAPHAWRELYPWLLAPALALLLLLHLPRGGRATPAALLAIGLVVPIPRTHAEDISQSAWQAWRSGHYAQAQDRYARLGGYQGALGAGAAAWQLRNYGDAAGYFSNALILSATQKERLDALYDLGNALYGLGRWQAAAEAFQAVLRLRPQDARAQANLRVSLWQLKRHAKPPGRPTGLRARPGLSAEGEVNFDWDSAAAVPSLKPTPPGPLVERGPILANGALLRGGSVGGAGGTPEIPSWQSGFKKMQLLRDDRLALVRGLLGADASQEEGTQ